MKNKLKYIAFLTGKNITKFDGDKKYFSTGNIGTENYEIVTYNNKPSRANIRVEESDILIAKMKNTNKTTIATKEMEKNIYSTGFTVLNTKKLYNRYFYYLLLSPEFIEKKDVFSVGTTQVSINDETLMNIELEYIYNNDKQKKISEFLDKKLTEIDNVIEKTKNTIEDYKRYKQSIITKAVTKGLNTSVKMKESNNKLIGKIPNHYNVVKVKTIANKVTDGAHVSPDVIDGKYDFISTVNVEEDKINFTNCLKTSEQSYKQLVSNGCKPELDDVLISKDGSVGKTIVVNFSRDFVVASSLVIIRTNTSLIIPKYLNYNLQSSFVQDELQMIMHGTALKRVSVEKNANLPIILIPKDEQEKIVNYLDKKVAQINNLIKQKEKIVEELEQYKKSLIYEYVTGKKEV